MPKVVVKDRVGSENVVRVLANVSPRPPKLLELDDVNISSNYTGDGALLVYDNPTNSFITTSIIDGPVEISSTRDSTSPSTGAFVVSGGVGIGASLHVSGTATFGTSTIVIDGDNNTITLGDSLTIGSDSITGPSTITIDPGTVGDNTGKVVIKGNLQVDGTQTIVNSTTVTVDDKNIVLGSGAVDDNAADGGGITLESGDGDKTLNWNNSTDSWTSSENFDLSSGKVYKVNGTEVLSSELLTVANINSSGYASLNDLNASGISTISNLNSTDITATNINATNINATSTGTTELSVSGLSTFSGISTFNAGLISKNIVFGLTDPNIISTISGPLQLYSADTVIDVNGQLVVAGTQLVNGEASFASDANFYNPTSIVTIQGLLSSTNLARLNTAEITTLTVSGLSSFTGNIDANGNLDVDGLSDLDELNVAGVSTFASNVDINASIDVDGHTELDELNVSGLSTFASNVDINADLNATDIFVSGVTSTTTAKIGAATTFTEDLVVQGDARVTGILTVGTSSIIFDGPNDTISVGGAATVSTSGFEVGISSVHSTGIQVGDSSIHTDGFDIGTSSLHSTGLTAENLNITGIITAASLDLSGISTFQNDAYFVDDVNAYFGSDNDLAIYHNSSTGNSIISALQDGNLNINATTHTFKNQLGTETKAIFNDNGSVELYYDNNKKLETIGTGVTVTGTTYTNQIDVSGNSTFRGNVYLGDGDFLYLGDSFDFQLYHTTAGGGTNYLRDNSTNGLRITSDNFSVWSKNLFDLMITATYNGSVNLYYDGLLRFQTTRDGSITSGISTATQLSTGDSGVGINISTSTITGPSEIIIDPAGINDDTGAVRIRGDLYVDGTTTQINSTSLEIADFVVGIASTATSDLLSDGAGIRVGPDNTILYDYTNTAFKFSENINLQSGKVYKINGSDVLTSTHLTVPNINSSGIGTISTLDTTTGTIDYLSGTDISYSGIGTISTLDTTTGTIDYLSGTDISYSGIGTIGTLYSDLTTTSGITSTNNLYVVGVSTFTNTLNVTGFVTVTEGLYYDVDDYDGPNGIAYFDNTGKLVSAASTTTEALTETLYVLTTNSSGVPKWSSTIDGGEF